MMMIYIINYKLMCVYHTKVDGAGYPKKAYGTKYFKNTRAKRMAS